MFEDNPPPLPPVDIVSEEPSDVNLADLEDISRLTAVADDDSFTLDDVSQVSSGSFQASFDIPVKSGDSHTVDIKILPTMTSTARKTEYESEPSSSDLPGVAVNGGLAGMSCSFEATLMKDTDEREEDFFNSAESSDFTLVSPELSNNEKESGSIEEQSNIFSKDPQQLIVQKQTFNTGISNCDAASGDFVNFDSEAEFFVENREAVLDGTEEGKSAALGFDVSCASDEATGSAAYAVSSEEAVLQFTADEAAYDDFDEFGDFAESSITEQPEATVEVASTSQIIIDSSELVQEELSPVDDDWVADFEASYVLPATTARAEVSKDADLSEMKDFFEEVLWRDEGLFSEIAAEMDDGDIAGLIEQMNTVLSRKGSLDNFESLWLAMSIIEEALALKFQWASSSTYFNFLDSLNVDLKTTWNPNVPAFAQQLSESTVLQPKSTMESEKKECPSYSSDASDPGSVGLRSTQKLPFDSLAVPPVQFDWNHSGLTNPLTSGSISPSSALLDLECLTTNDPGLAAGKSNANEVSSTLQKDLAALGLDVSSQQSNIKSAQTEDLEKKQFPFDQLMKKDGNGRRYVPANELSLDARALHDQLPDLDYMLSNVLLFPMTNR